MTEVKQDVYQAALAGLLHDIGKFAQRAGENADNQQAIEIVKTLIPEQWHSMLHPGIVAGNEDTQKEQDQSIELAAQLAAATKRKDESKKQSMQLNSIFCSLKTDDENYPEEEPRRYLPLYPLVLDNEEHIFPGFKYTQEEIQDGYRRLWGIFEHEAQKLYAVHGQNPNLETYLENLLLLMQRTTWCVPASYYDKQPDTSLYDHSRITAALAVCLAELSAAQVGKVSQGPQDSEEQVAILIGGDISGVQDFIYTITSRGATSALRGRSFYLQLLTEAVMRFVLQKLALPVTNVIYQGGGHFTILGRPGDQEHLKEIQQEISRILLKHHRGELYLALSHTELLAKDFYNGRIASKWDELARRQQSAKQRRFSELDKTDLEKIFTPQGAGGNEDKQCQVCGKEHPNTQPRDKEIRKCPPCHSYEKLGNQLRNANYLWIKMCDPEQKDSEPGNWVQVLREFGIKAGLTENLTEIRNTDGNNRVILALGDSVIDNLQPGHHTAVGRRFLVNVTPLITQEEIDELREDKGYNEELPNAGSIKPFSVLEKHATGIQRMGVLRMDVDNLGTLFAEGFGTYATLTRIAGLSFTISLYFEGWVEKIAQSLSQEENLAQHTQTLYSIYSGGDDLFVVGAWDVVVEFARQVRTTLTRFAAGHPGIHASGGIILANGKYPLYQAAEDAGRAESQAKRYTREDTHTDKHQSKEHNKKDAITFLGQTLPWEKFGLSEGEDTVYGQYLKLYQMIKEDEIPESLIQRLLQIYTQYNEAVRKSEEQGDGYTQDGQTQSVYGPWIWRGYYMLKRQSNRLRRQGKPFEDLDNLAKLLNNDRFCAIEWVGLAARWVDLLTRKS